MNSSSHVFGTRPAVSSSSRMSRPIFVFVKSRRSENVWGAPLTTTTIFSTNAPKEAAGKASASASTAAARQLDIRMQRLFMVPLLVRRL